MGKIKVIVDTGEYRRYKKAMKLFEEYRELQEKMEEFEQKLNDILFDIVNED